MGIAFDTIITTVDSTKTVGQTEDFTISGHGDLRAALAFHNEATSSRDPFARINSGWAAKSVSDTVNRRRSVSFSANNAVNPSKAGRNMLDTAIINAISANGGTTLDSLDFSAWITDGIRVAYDNAFGENERLFWALANDTNVTHSHAGTQALGTGTSAINITAPGFEPDVVIVATSCDNNNTPGAFGTQAYGICINDGSDTQYGYVFNHANNVSPTSISSTILDDAVVGQCSTSGVAWKATIGSFDPSGFSITPSASASNDDVFYIALKFSSSVAFDLKEVTIPTSGNQAVTGLSFTPDFALEFYVQGVTTFGTVQTSDLGLYTAMKGDNGAGVLSAVSEDNVTVENSDSGYASASMISPNTGTEAAWSAWTFDSEGYDRTITTNPSSALKGFALLIGESATDVTVNASTESLTLTTYAADISVDTEIDANVEAITLTTYSADISVDTEIDAAVEQLTLTTYPASVSVDADVLIEASTEALTLTTYPATVDVDIDVDINVSVELLEITTHQADISVDTEIDAQPESLTLTTYQATITSGARLQVVQINGYDIL